MLLLFVIIWGIFTYFPIFSKKTFELSINKEEKLGNLLVEEILKQNDEVNSSEVDSALFIIMKRLLNALDTTDYDYNIYVLENEQINAFATLGGNIFVFSGLIEFTENPEELATILAHEMGHVESRDVVHKLIKDLGITILTSVLGGNDVILIGEISRTAASTVFDRKQEKEADQFAMDLLVKSNVNPRVIASLFRRIKDEQGLYNKVPEFLLTHPHSNSRIKAALSYELPDSFNNVQFKIDWEKVKESINIYSEKE